MFDLSSSKLLILGLVALIVVGPKELPLLLRTIGKYVGMIRRQAAEFRSQFDDAMRESELDTIKKDVEAMGQDMATTMREAELSVEKEVATANAELEASLAKNPPPEFGHIDALGPSSLEPAPSMTPIAAEPAATAPAEPAKVGA
jgi:sec-independent protein translocase protein TatB